MDLTYIWAGIAIWLSWLGVTLGQWMLTRQAIEILWINPKMASSLRIYTILGIALVESAAIYWFVIAYQILTTPGIEWINAIAAWLAIWITAFGAWYWEWKLVSGAMWAFNMDREHQNTTLQFMILFLALIEVVAIYGMIVAQQIIW